MVPVAHFDNTIIGMNRQLLVIILLLTFSGCMALAPKMEEPMYVEEPDVIGQWEPWKKPEAIIDIQDADVEEYPDASLLVKINADHTYEEIVTTADEALKFQSTWRFEKYPDGSPHFSVEETRYWPKEAKGAFIPLYDLRADLEDYYTFYLCYGKDPDEAWMCLEKVDKAGK